jgi:hypothetical protein
MSNLSIAAIESGQIYLTKKFMRGEHVVSRQGGRQKRPKQSRKATAAELDRKLGQRMSHCKDGEGIVDANGFTHFKCKCKDSRTFSSAKEFEAHFPILLILDIKNAPQFFFWHTLRVLLQWFSRQATFDSFQ